MVWCEWIIVRYLEYSRMCLYIYMVWSVFIIVLYQECYRTCLIVNLWNQRTEFVAIARQQDALWQLHPEVCAGVFWVQHLAGIAGQCENHGAVRSMCRIRHLGVLCRLSAPMQLSTMVLLGCNKIVIDLNHFDFPVEAQMAQAYHMAGRLCGGSEYRRSQTCLALVQFTAWGTTPMALWCVEL